MARVTVEDCVQKVPNRFELVLLAANRARSIAQGASLTVDRDNDKNPVVALREIADDTIGVETMRQTLIGSLQQKRDDDGPEEDNMHLLMQGQDWAGVQQETEQFGDGMAVVEGEELDAGDRSGE